MAKDEQVAAPAEESAGMEAKARAPAKIWVEFEPRNWPCERILYGDTDEPYVGYVRADLVDPATVREAELYEALTDVLDVIGALSKPHELIGYGMSQDDIDRIFSLIKKGIAK